MMGIGMSCVACGSYGIRQIAYKIAQAAYETDKTKVVVK